ncbi:Transposable element Tcb2 transposase like protein [Argiope bruennichi]|uniref:Transposable element Tcb2 transposase like protein n=1 Tax=Argiope bruennichi TaxID=94029 RepID=A0A8T0G0A3_ARGBR|nr:Transposable element Tcb2 transposase like protein [Argiope bruennichi]
MNYVNEILQLEHDFTEREIAQKLGIPPSTVHYWLHKRKPTKKSGRRSKTTTEIDESIYNLSSLNPFLPATVIKKQLDIDVSAETIRRRLKQRGLKNRAVATKPFLKPYQRQKRLEFANYYLTWNMDDWETVIFSDEKIFSSVGYGPVRVWRPDGQRFNEKYLHSDKHSSRFTISVWVCIGFINKIHLIARKTLNAEYYVNSILINTLGEIADTSTYIFMHDLSPVHTSKLAQNWLIDNDVNVLWDWPPKGADLNPVENLFGELERRMVNRNPKNDWELWEMVRDTFQEVTSEECYVKKLIESVPRRLKAVADKGGGFSKY